MTPKLGPQRVSFGPIQRKYFVTLARTGLFGRTPGDVARQLVNDQLQQLVQEGWIALPTAKPADHGKE